MRKPPPFPAKIITKIDRLRDYAEPYQRGDFPAAVELGRHLMKLCKARQGLGLAAIQLGIPRSVCVVNVIDPIILINPNIVWRSLATVNFLEGALRKQQSRAITIRAKSVKIAYVDEGLKCQTRFFGATRISKRGECKRILEAIYMQRIAQFCCGELYVDYLKEDDEIHASADSGK